MKRTSGSPALLFFLAALSLVLLILSSSGYLYGVEGVLSTFARPFLIVFNGVGRQVSNVFTTLRDLNTLRSTNQQLQSQVNTLIIDNLRMREVAIENQRLRELLQFAQLNPTYDIRGGQVIARVIAQQPSNYLASLSIDLGSEHGIKEGMPVVTEAGLVGRIHKVGPSTSTVLLITDPRSGVQALVQRENSRARGVVTGRAGALPVMEFISQDVDVTPGDLIITSGLGGNFPKGLVIGQVVQVQRRDFDMFQQAVVRPTVDFDRIEFVLVIMNFRPLPGQPEELESVG